MKTYTFENLACWQHARKLAVWTYRATKHFPGDERFGLISQMRRAAVSIASNLAEGTSLNTPKDQSHFSTISYSSTIELLNDLIISKDLDYLPEDQYAEGRNMIEYQTLLISNLRRSQSVRSLINNTKPSKPSQPPL